MTPGVRRFFQKIPLLRSGYSRLRKAYHQRRVESLAAGYFVNMDVYRKALRGHDGKIVEIHTKDGLTVAIRRNYMDAMILAEIFVDNCYVQDLSLPERPTIVDIGGYIGDFALFAAKHLDASKVVVCEPSPHNWALLVKNVALNRYEDRIETVNKAVTDGDDVMMNVDAPDGGQAMVSAYGGNTSEQRLIPGVTLASLVEEHGLTVIDLLKIDCEGGEYPILSNTSSEVLSRIRNIVFEYHEIEGFKSKLKAVTERLCDEGFSLTQRGSLISASRP